VELLRPDELACLVHHDLAAGDFGGFGSAVSSFSSRTQLDATRVDSSACAEVSKKPTELMTPLPASIALPRYDDLSCFRLVEWSRRSTVNGRTVP
jgi:hypothetical protein